MKASSINLVMSTSEATNERLASASHMLWFMWQAHHVSALVQSPYFELLRISDGKYTLIVHKVTAADKVTIKFSKNQKAAQSFTN